MPTGENPSLMRQEETPFVMKGEQLQMEALSKPVRMLMAAFLGQFAADLKGPLSREQWCIPQGLTMPGRARFVIAQMLRENTRQTSMRH